MVPIHGVYDMLATSAAVMMLQLAVGRPIRGGIDVGAGIEVDGELFGAALVKSYQAEAKRARHPRIVVGKGFIEYLGNSTNAFGSRSTASCNGTSPEAASGASRQTTMASSSSTTRASSS